METSLIISENISIDYTIDSDKLPDIDQWHFQDDVRHTEGNANFLREIWRTLTVVFSAPLLGGKNCFGIQTGFWVLEFDVSPLDGIKRSKICSKIRVHEMMMTKIKIKYETIESMTRIWFRHTGPRSKFLPIFKNPPIIHRRDYSYWQWRNLLKI